MWDIKMKTRLYIEYLWDIVLKGFKEPMFQYHKNNDTISLSLIRQGFNERILPRIEKEKSTKEAWIIKKKVWGKEEQHQS